MLYIDDKIIEVIKQEIFVGKFTNKGNEGFNINILIEFINVEKKEKGYINLSVGFEKDNNINSFLNREYSGMPYDIDDNNFIFLEIYDTEKFLDSDIESKIFIKLENIVNNKIKSFFEINDDLIKLVYDGYLVMDFSKTKETFCHDFSKNIL